MPAVAKIDEKACNKPKRHRTADIPIFIVVDLIALALVVLRFYMRWTKSAQLEADDMVIALMVVFWIIFQGLGLQSTLAPASFSRRFRGPSLSDVASLAVRIHAIGRDIWDLDPETITNTQKVSRRSLAEPLGPPFSARRTRT